MLHNTGITLNSTNKLMFNDASQLIFKVQVQDGDLDIAADRRNRIKLLHSN